MDVLDRLVECPHCRWIGRMGDAKLGKVLGSPLSCPRCGESEGVGYYTVDDGLTAKKQ